MNFIHFIYIDGNMYLQIDVYGELVPGYLSIEEVLKGLKKKGSEASISDFCRISNDAISSLDKKYNPQKYFHKGTSEQGKIEIYAESQEIEKRRLEVFYATVISNGVKADKLIQIIDFFQTHGLCKFVQAEALLAWYQMTVCNFTGGDMQGNRKMASKHIIINHKAFKGVSALEEYKLSAKKIKKTKKDNADIFIMYPIAMTTYEFVEEFNNCIYEQAIRLSPVDSELLNLEIRRMELTKELASRAESEKSEYYYFCIFCNQFYISPQGITPKSCGHPECEAKYSTSKNPSTYKRTDWVLDPTVKPKLCRKCNSRQKRLNSQCYCRGCWDELLTP
jgi:hypothetical protein